VGSTGGVLVLRLELLDLQSVLAVRYKLEICRLHHGGLDGR
jgi:hypothetical protein